MAINGIVSFDNTRYIFTIDEDYFEQNIENWEILKSDERKIIRESFLENLVKFIKGDFSSSIVSMSFLDKNQKIKEAVKIELIDASNDEDIKKIWNLFGKNNKAINNL